MGAPAVIGTIDRFKGMIEARKTTLREILPTHISIEKFQAAATTAAVMNGSILQCEMASVLTSLMKCAADGLVPDGREAALVPFKGRAQYLPMVQGVIKQLRNSSEVASVWSDVVYEGEELRVWVEDGERKFDHTYDPLRRGGAIVGAYAVAKLKDGTIEFEPMGREQIEKRRRASSNQRGGTEPSGVWADWYEEMARKTVIKALAKRLPISSEDLRRVQEIDEQEPPVEAVAAKTLEERLRDAQASPPPDPEPVEPDVEDAEVLSDDAPVYDPDEASPMDDAYDEGVKAAQAGGSEADNPYRSNPDFSSWVAGFRHAGRAK